MKNCGRGCFRTSLTRTIHPDPDPKHCLYASWATPPTTQIYKAFVFKSIRILYQIQWIRILDPIREIRMFLWMSLLARSRGVRQPVPFCPAGPGHQGPGRHSAGGSQPSQAVPGPAQGYEGHRHLRYPQLVVIYAHKSSSILIHCHQYGYLQCRKFKNAQ